MHTQICIVDSKSARGLVSNTCQLLVTSEPAVTTLTTAICTLVSSETLVYTHVLTTKRSDGMQADGMSQWRKNCFAVKFNYG